MEHHNSVSGSLFQVVGPVAPNTRLLMDFDADETPGWRNVAFLQTKVFKFKV